MSGELGKASLDLEANLGPFEKNVTVVDESSDRLRGTLEALAEVADVAQHALNEVKLGTAQASASRISAEGILEGVHGISDESRTAARELDRVELGTAQATASKLSAEEISAALDQISRNADEAKRKLLEVRLARGRNGAGVGPFGSGFGRVGVLGTAIGVGAVTAPAAAPAAVGLLAAIPGFAAAGAGALGTLALAFRGVGKAIGGDKKAFDALTSSQKQFVQTVRSLDGFSDRLKQIAGQSLFPGLTKGLKAALSPGTINAIETALVQLGHALGSAGAAWGKYFGSARFQNIFGPLMQSAARNIGVMSDAFLHLFDALGVLARAAIPFTNWLTSAIDRGSKFADAWLRARDATGQLGGAMHKAQTSLRLVAGLAGSLLKVIFALGKALYPVARIAVKDLTDGLNALAGAIAKGAPALRGALGGAIAVLVTAVKVAGPAIGTLDEVLLKLIGVLGRSLVPVIRGLKPIFDALQTVFRQLEPPLAKIIHDLGHEFGGVVKALAKPLGDLIKALGPVFVGALKLLDPLLRASGKAIVYAARAFGFLIEKAAKALTWIENHWKRLGGFFRNLGHAIVNAFKYAWYLLKVGALKAALAIVEPFSHLPSFLGGWARKAKSSMQHQLNKLHAPNMNWSGYASKAGAETGAAWRGGFLGGIAGLVSDAFKAVGGAISHLKKNKPKHDHGPKPGTHAWYMQELGYDPTQQGPTFGPPPPFTKNLGGKPAVIPAAASHFLALASAQASIAANTKSVKKERRALEREIADLENADKILVEKWRHAHGKAKTELFNAITATENEIRAARKKLHDAAGQAEQSKLDFALAKAQVAAENATQGTKAWDKAIASEEKALRAEIRYWDRRAHNSKLSDDARTAALKKELSYQKKLKALLSQTKQAAAANIAQFLQSFTDIENTFGSNFQPVPPGSNGKTDTHLYDIKNEARESNRHLRAMRDKGRFPGSQMGQDSAMAATT